MSPLGGPSIRRFLETYFSAVPVPVRDARIEETAGDRLVVSGVASLMGGDMSVVATVRADATGDLSVALRCRPTAG